MMCLGIVLPHLIFPRLSHTGFFFAWISASLFPVSNFLYKKEHIMKTLAFILSFAILVFVPLQSFAEDKADEGEKAPVKNEVVAAAEDFIKDLDEPSKRHFTVLYGNYNLITVVEEVEDGIDLAVDACSEANPDMKEALESRFDEWKDAVRPVIKEADAHIGNMILAQDYSKPRKIRKFFKLIDKARKEKSKDVKKMPVTTPEACQSLLEKMNETQGNMTKLLRMTLLSLPQVMQEQDEKARAEAEEAAKKKAEEEAEKEDEAE